MNLIRKWLVSSFAISTVFCAPSLRILPEHQIPAQLLTLPGNATSIRANIEDGFSCEGRSYGYYADVENDCQLFHVCLPITYPTGRTQIFRWSFICPEETIFNQEMFTCTRADESIDCMESPRYYNLNRNLNGESEKEVEEDTQSLNADVFGQNRPALEPTRGHSKPRPQIEPELVDDATSGPEVPQLFEHGSIPGSDREPKPIYNRRIG